MRFIPLVALALVLIVSVGHASVVSLTGSCISNVITSGNNYVSFSIHNSGNGTATNMQIVPHLNGYVSQISVFSIPYLDPGATKNYSFYLYNFSTPGTYVGYLLASYGQGGSNFFATFPCGYNIGHASQSLITIANASVSGSTIHVKLINIGSNSIVANLSFIRPPNFAMSPQYQNVTVPPISSSDVSVGFTAQQLAGSTFTIGVVASYVFNNTEYSTYTPLTIGQPAASSSILSVSTLVEIGFVALIVVVAILIIAAVLRRRHKAHRHAHAKEGESNP